LELLLYRSLWGYHGSAIEAAEEIPDSVYDGLEAEFPPGGAEQAALVDVVEAEELRFIPLIDVRGDTPAQQVDVFRACLEQVSVLAPDRIVAQTGIDAWPLSEAIHFYEVLVEVEQELDVRVAHETHRGRPLATPWATSDIISEVPDLGLCCDFSHWVLVCERLLEDQEPALEHAARRALHLHARVGTDQAPQVQDPADPVVAAELATFEKWWDLVWDEQQRAGFEFTTLTPEYGPPPYQPLTADSPTLAAKLSAICDWQATRARERFDGRGRP
jgi:hypothetical protein